jgi:hypothetical protein
MTRLQAGTRDFSPLQDVKTSCVANAASRAVWRLEWPGSEVYHQLPSSAKIKNEQKYYLYFLCMPSWHVQGLILNMRCCECGYKPPGYITTAFFGQLNK